MARRRPNRQQTRAWQPMTPSPINPAMAEHHLARGPHVVQVEAWGNDLYQATVQRWANGCAYISVKRNDRHPIRDWRHLQAIKNEICGTECEAVELFPAESRLVDEANQYHLWVLPEGERWPLGEQRRTLGTPDDMQTHNAESRARGQAGKGRQRPWQPGLPTGLGFERAEW